MRQGVNTKIIWYTGYKQKIHTILNIMLAFFQRQGYTPCISRFSLDHIFLCQRSLMSGIFGNSCFVTQYKQAGIGRKTGVVFTLAGNHVFGRESAYGKML